MNNGDDIDLAKLSDEQLLGDACCRCGGVSGPMIPLRDVIMGWTLFVHSPRCTPEQQPET